MNKILLISLLFSINAFAEDNDKDGLLLHPNAQMTTSGWVNGKYVTKNTTVDSTGHEATTSGWITDDKGQAHYETDHTVINSTGTEATTQGWHNGQYVTKHTTINK